MAHSHGAHAHDRHGARQPERFDPARAAVLDDPERFTYVAPDALLALLDPPAGSTLIDFGTGTGLYAFAIAQRRPDLRVLAVDEQDAMLGIVREKLAASPASPVTAVDAAGLVHAPQRAQRILALNVLHELGDDALRTMLDLLEPGGVALVVDWRRDPNRTIGPPNDHVYSEDEARERLRSFAPRVTPAGAFAHHYALLVTR